jgi:hypothetical protein
MSREVEIVRALSSVALSRRPRPFGCEAQCACAIRALNGYYAVAGTV